MKKYMTEEEIAAEQEIIRQQSSINFNSKTLEEAAVRASEVSDEDGDKATPIDLLNSNNYVDRNTRELRYDICKGCERLFKPTKSCKECGCFMSLKTWLKEASCPIGKW